MSARERKERFFRAANEGRQAFLNGDSRESCPYKKSMWGMGYAWDMGYSEISFGIVLLEIPPTHILSS